MNKDIYDWLIIVLNYFIFIYIFINVYGKTCFSISNQSIALFGLIASVYLLSVRTFKKYFET